MTVFTISNEKHMKNVGWSLGETEIVRAALDLCRQSPEDALIDVVARKPRLLLTASGAIPVRYFDFWPGVARLVPRQRNNACRLAETTR
jgi:hypothetical protein